MGVFAVAFGVALQAILHPMDSFTPIVLIEILNKVYWPIYGEITILDEISNTTCFNDSTWTEHNPECFDLATHISSYILLMIYMIGASVLLINLLIAMFRYFQVF